MFCETAYMQSDKLVAIIAKRRGVPVFISDLIGDSLNRQTKPCKPF